MTAPPLGEFLVDRTQQAGVVVPDEAVVRAAGATHPHVAAAVYRGELRPDVCVTCRGALAATARVLHAGADAIVVEELRNSLRHDLEPMRAHATDGQALEVIDDLITATRARIDELGGHLHGDPTATTQRGHRL